MGRFFYMRCEQLPTGSASAVSSHGIDMEQKSNYQGGKDLSEKRTSHFEKSKNWDKDKLKDQMNHHQESHSPVLE